MAKVNSFDFGSIVIDGKKYTYDVIVLPDGTVRERELDRAHFGAHKVTKKEIQELTKANPETVVVGTGSMGLARMSEDAQDYAREAKLNLVILPSSKAIEKLNQLVDERKPTAALIHITC